jgi:hypothetical protein
VAAVSVEVCAAVLVIETELEERLHVAGLEALNGEVTAQLSETVPVNEFDGVTLMVELPELPALTAMLPLLVSVKSLLFGACQKSPQPARTETERPTSTDAASTNLRRAHPPMFIAAPLLACFHIPGLIVSEEFLADFAQIKEYRFGVRPVSLPDLDAHRSAAVMRKGRGRAGIRSVWVVAKSVERRSGLKSAGFPPIG